MIQTSLDTINPIANTRHPSTPYPSPPLTRKTPSIQHLPPSPPHTYAGLPVLEQQIA